MGAPSKARFGQLTVQIVGGTELKPPSLANTPDPFAKVRIGGQEHNTKVHTGGGKNPVFGDSFVFEISNEKEIEVLLLDKQPTGAEKLMGQVRVSFMGWVAKGSFEGDLDLKDEQGQPAGTVTVKANFARPDAVSAPPPPGAAPPRGLPGPSGAVGGVQGSEPPRDPNGKFTDQEIKEAFQAFDLDHNNFVGAAEIRHVLINIGENVTDEEVDEMIRMCDKDGDGQVSFEEFYEMVSNGKKVPPGLWDGPGGGGQAGQMAPAAGMATASSAAPVIAQRNARKNALDDFAKEYNIKPESIKKAYKRFQETDVDHSGLIDYTEFCEILQVDPAPQVEKLFQLFDRDKSGQIDVKEFMIGLANFSGASKEEKLKFAFMVFDEDGNGVITKQELIKILKANHMAGTEKEVMRKAETIMMQADKDGDGVISFDEFVIVSKKFPNILFPAYSLGQKLQKTMGV